jgi:hypothetical protein
MLSTVSAYLNVVCCYQDYLRHIVLKKRLHWNEKEAGKPIPSRPLPRFVGALLLCANVLHSTPGGLNNRRSPP